MEKSVTEQVKEYLVQNPLAKMAEVREIFKVSRQLINQAYHQVYSADEQLQHKMDKDSKFVPSIKEALLQRKCISVIAAELKISKSRLKGIIDYTHELSTIIQDFEHEEAEKINDMSVDWCANFSIKEMMAKYSHLGSTVVAVSSSISKLREKYGESKFPTRINNQDDLKVKYEKYLELLAAGQTYEEISKTLGYKSVFSMRASFSQFLKKKAP